MPIRVCRAASGEEGAREDRVCSAIGPSGPGRVRWSMLCSPRLKLEHVTDPARWSRGLCQHPARWRRRPQVVRLPSEQMSGHLTIVGLDGTLPDGDRVVELAAAV